MKNDFHDGLIIIEINDERLNEQLFFGSFMILYFLFSLSFYKLMTLVPADAYIAVITSIARKPSVPSTKGARLF